MKKHIYIYSPSSTVRDKASFRRGIKRLQALGHEVEVDAAALAKFQRFAGDDAARLAAIDRAAASGADLALISRGGYGLTRILPAIKYKTLAKSIEKGTQFVGMSDFTALQTALLAKTGATTWAGPVLGEDFGSAEGPDEIMAACFNDLMTGQGEGAGWRLPKVQSIDAIIPVAASANKSAAKDRFIVNKALLWGGNLSVLTGMLGTTYFPSPERVKGGILFIEDVAEHPYRVERMLTQLLHSGVLASQKAVVFGQFNRYKTVPGYDSGYSLKAVVTRLQTQIKAVVLTGLPFGHVHTKVLLPVGAKVTLVVEGRDALIVWGDRH